MLNYYLRKSARGVQISEQQKRFGVPVPAPFLDAG